MITELLLIISVVPQASVCLHVAVAHHIILFSIQCFQGKKDRGKDVPQDQPEVREIFTFKSWNPLATLDSRILFFLKFLS